MISVVVPALNEEKLIGDCLESLRKQDYKGHYEVVVVDNGSTDRTAEIARSFNARVIACPKRGVSHARQAGAEAAAGEIIVQADADTVYPEGWLTRLQMQFSSHPDAVAIAGRFIYKTPPWWAIFEYFLRVFFDILSVLLFGKPMIISGANFAYYKKSLLQIGGYDPASYSSDQYNIASRLSKIGKVVYDRRLEAITSNRSVQKPLYSILMAFIAHLARFFKNALVSSGGSLQASFTRFRSSRSGRVFTPGRVFPILLPVVLIGLVSYGYFVPASPVFGKVYYQAEAPASAKIIALTFDDGPNEPYTSQILEILDSHQIQATFFIVGYNAALYPAILKRMRTRGHIIGNHSYSHLANHALHFNGITDIRQAQKSIFDASGVLPHLYRPPHGRKTPWELMAVQKEGLIEVVWSNSTNELSHRTPAQLASEIIRKSKPGKIILLHDGYGTNHNDAKSNKSLTVEILPLIIEQLQAEGYRFVTVPELLKVPAYIQTVP